MILDTSVWIDHFRTRNAALTTLLDEGLAGTHPFIIGELAPGNLKSRRRLSLISKLCHKVPSQAKPKCITSKSPTGYGDSDSGGWTHTF